MSEGGEIQGYRGTEDSVPIQLSPGYHSPDGGKTWYVTEAKYPDAYYDQSQYYMYGLQASCYARPTRWQRFKNWFRR